jgi:hypothetical protein
MRKSLVRIWYGHITDLYKKRGRGVACASDYSFLYIFKLGGRSHPNICSLVVLPGRIVVLTCICICMYESLARDRLDQFDFQLSSTSMV